MKSAPAQFPEARGGIDVLKVIPKVWSYTFSVADGTESVAQAVDLSWFGDKGELRLEGATYSARRDKSSYFLESAAGELLARAERPRRWFRELVIEHSGHQYTLRAKSALRRQFLLLEGSTQIGSLTPEGLFTRKAAVDLPATIPLFLQVFTMWLVMMLWKHDDAAIGAGAVVAIGGAGT
ncbi:MAG TPA: hypothetical protein VGO41_10185 [Steroidobacteraceae bacterium]|jgi:hypothetical protein|nr:hypothetical protein [Steroidobacteraceae bacterium]